VPGTSSPPSITAARGCRYRLKADYTLGIEAHIFILSEAKNLALRIFMNIRDSSSPAAPQNDSAYEFSATR
jgi:hypothetical protein